MVRPVPFTSVPSRPPLLGRGLVFWPGVCGWVRPGSEHHQGPSPRLSLAWSLPAAGCVLGTWSPEGNLPQPRAHLSLLSPAPTLVRA